MIMSTSAQCLVCQANDNLVCGLCGRCQLMSYCRNSPAEKLDRTETPQQQIQEVEDQGEEGDAIAPPFVPEPPSLDKCARCGASERSNNAPLLHCGRCKSAAYCGRECQAQHWKEGGHKKACAQVRKKEQRTK
jgi:hypothetical protein